MAGVVYDINALSALDDRLQNQENQFAGIDKEQGVQDKKLLRYAAILAGSVIFLIGLRIILIKTKK